MNIQLNEKQQAFINLVKSNQSCCLVGAAGSGKTTAVRTAIQALLTNPNISTIKENTGTQTNPKLRKDLAGIAGLAFTRRAVSNLKNNFPNELHPHCMTVHALLEYSPVYYEELDNAGNIKTKMRFEPRRNKLNPLPPELKTVVIDEASMLSVELFNQLIDAIRHHVQLIFIGDINQLSPVFGDAILGYKLLELPAIELSEIYRTALDSPILKLAHRVLSGKQILSKEFESDWRNANVTIANYKQATSAETAEATAVALLKREYEKGEYDPFNDMVLIPFNKSFGTLSLSKHIANFIDKSKSITCTEVIAGYFKTYYAVGDYVLFNNDEYIITKIARNGLYNGSIPVRDCGFDRFGNAVFTKTQSASYENTDILDFINLSGDVVEASSHVIYLTPLESTSPEEDTFSIDTRGAINKLTLAYAITGHKAQGLESNRVFIFIHKSHSILINREWLYTSITRAKKNLTIVCEKDTFIGGINKQQIKGTTMQEKAKYFMNRKQSKLSLG